MSIVESLIKAAGRLHNKGFLAACDGNLSYRVSDGEILITPSGRPKYDLSAKEFARVNLEGGVLSGHPSSELPLHLEIYRRCSQAKAIVHAHPPIAIAWTIAHPEFHELPIDCISELILAVGRLPIAPYAEPGSAEMAESIAPFLPDCRVILMARHGAISWGETVEEAYMGIERLEHSATILKAAHELGGLTSLPKEKIEKLRALRAKLGSRTF